MTPISNTDTLVRRDGRPTTDLDGDLVLLDAKGGEYQIFRGTARRIWDLLAQPTTVGALCDVLVAEYSVPPEQCRGDLISFLGELERLELLEVRRG